MASVIKFFSDLWESVFTPGVTPVLIQATHLSFGSLLAVLIFLLVSTGSFHFIILIALATGLWAAITWFVDEINKMEEAEKQKKLKLEESKASDSTVETNNTDSAKATGTEEAINAKTRSKKV